jgi:hypothetical protein
LTIVLRKSDEVPLSVTGGQSTVALRMIDHPLARDILRRFGSAVAAPSANRFGRVSPTTAEHVRADLGDDVDLIVDGGPSRIGVESTIVDLTGDVPAILRLGAIGPTARAAAATCAHPACSPRTTRRAPHWSSPKPARRSASPQSCARAAGTSPNSCCPKIPALPRARSMHRCAHSMRRASTRSSSRCRPTPKRTLRYATGCCEPRPPR